MLVESAPGPLHLKDIPTRPSKSRASWQDGRAVNESALVFAPLPAVTRWRVLCRVGDVAPLRSGTRGRRAERGA